MGDDAAAQVGLGLIKKLGSSKKRSRDKALRLLLKKRLELGLRKKLGSCKKRSRVLNLKVSYRMFQKKRSRDEALRLLLNSWLPSQPNITDDIMKKLWKGLLYCVLDADVHSCDRLIDLLFSFLHRLHNSSISLLYFSTFLLTVRRKWCAVNVPNLLTRRFLHYSFAFLKLHHWDLDLTSRFFSILEDTMLTHSAKQGKKKSFGVSFHIASVFLEELRPFLPLQPEVLEVVFQPFFSVLRTFPDDVLLREVRGYVFGVLFEMGNKLLKLKKLGKLGDDNELLGDDDAVVLGRIVLNMRFSRKFLELRYSDEYCQWTSNLLMNRHVLFVLYKEFIRLENDLEFSGILQLPNPRGTDMDNDAVEDVASACELPKKRKRTESMNGQNPKLNIEGDAESKMNVATYYGAFHESLSAYQIMVDNTVGLPRQWLPKRTRFSDSVYRDLPKKTDFYYSDGMFWNTEYFDPPKLVTQDEALRNTVVALEIFLSSGKHSKWVVGSGVVISEDGLVLTCAHLFRDYEKPEYSFQGAKVIFFNEDAYMVEVITEDVGKDLALLKILAPDDPEGLKFSHAPLAVAQETKTGMDAYMVLNTHYFLVYQLTKGTIRYEKSLYRDLEFENFLKLDHDTAIIQTDIDCIKGNFGGPLFNSNGEIMGVQFADTGTSKLGIHVESILSFRGKYNALKEKNIW